ncbi:DUF4102 domain-containing protein [Fusobacterium necrophorum subsp. funduliforme]|nr:hypothetical protein HMPREF9466_02923 [Fusobacterium necrophorum subsp. funduliforme 1_1_36S]
MESATRITKADELKYKKAGKRNGYSIRFCLLFFGK